MGEAHSKKEVGKRLKDLRRKMGVTQEQFAEMLDISTQLYKKMEIGENNISINTLNKMKNKLNFSSDYLLFGERDTLIEVWNKTLTLHDMDKQLLLFKLFCEVSLNNNQAESKEAAEKYMLLFEKIKDSLSDGDNDGKESLDTGR